jgi:hypothetical protein
MRTISSSLAAKFKHPSSGDEMEIRTPLPAWADFR